MSSEDRRTPGATRIPLEGLVEMGGAVGPTFEAQAVNVSEEGLQVRSAYLPEPGQPLTCRFDVGSGQSVLAAGEVAWARGAGRGGELGIRFTDMDPESIDALKRACAVPSPAHAPVPAGSKVRLHIEGLASPMRAKIRDSRTSEITVGSDLGFLQVGKQLELEDAQSGTKRPASIDCVEVVVDPASNVPQLVVTLRYADVDPSVDAPAPAASPDHGYTLAGGAPPAPPGPAAAKREAPATAEAPRADDLAAMADASLKMKTALTRNIGRIGPALERLANQAKTTVALLAKRRRERVGAEDAPRRTTAPAPGGGLHTSGRRVVRGEAATGGAEEGSPVAQPKLKLTKRKAAVASAVMIAAVLGAIAIKKSHHETAPDSASATQGEGAAPSVPSAASALAATPPPALTTPPSFPAPSPADPGAAFGAMPPSVGGTAMLDDEAGSSSRASHKKHARVAPFGNGPVHHGNVIHLQMDGPIESLEGAQQPTGFAVKIPGRKSLEAAGPLAARDARIAAMKVSNESTGAELTVTFRDGVPNYQVSARGDTLVIALAPVGALEKTAKKDDPPGKTAKHLKPSHDRQKTDLR